MIEEELILLLSFNRLDLNHLGLCPHRPKLFREFVVCEDTDHGREIVNL